MNISKKSNWIFVVGIIVLTVLCSCLQTQIEPIDAVAFQKLNDALGWVGKPAADNAAWDVLLALLMSSFALMIGFVLARKPRIFAFAQLFVIALLAQWFLYFSFGLSVHMIGTACTVALAGLTGYVLRRLRLRDQKYEAQYHELTLKNRELQETRMQIVKQDEIERRMLAADLHDQVLNDLKSLKQNVDSYVKQPQSEVATTIERLLQQAMSEIRDVMDSLSPSALEHLGLVAAIEDCCRRGAERGNFKARFKSTVDETLTERLSAVEQSLLYRLVQESITNVCKHANASIVRTNVSAENDQLLIRICDDGKGLEPGKLQQESRGIRYMRQRADLIGATIAWLPGEDQKGTAVEIRVDLSNRNDYANTDS